MNTVCRGHKFAFVHLDIMVACKNEAEHLRYLREMFSLDFLGHRITHTGIMPLLDKVDAITRVKQPATSNRHGPARICRHVEFLPNVHTSCCTEDVATLRGINRQAKDTGLG